MKVKELLEKLRDANPDLDVCMAKTPAGDDCWHCTETSLEHLEDCQLIWVDSVAQNRPANSFVLWP